MTATNRMRLEWALKRLKEEEERELAGLREMDGCNLTQVIVIRNKKYMYIAELRQMIRNIKDDIAKLEEAS